MTNDTTGSQADAQVIQLRAAGAPTEVQLGEAHPSGAVYVDVSEGRASRKPIIPAHLRDGDGLAGLARGVRAHLHHEAVRHGHAAAYHAVRSPRYLTLTFAWAIVGAFRIGGRVLRWWHATDLYQLEHQAAADGLLTDHVPAAAARPVSARSGPAGGTQLNHLGAGRIRARRQPR